MTLDFKVCFRPRGRPGRPLRTVFVSVDKQDSMQASMAVALRAARRKLAATQEPIGAYEPIAVALVREMT